MAKYLQDIFIYAPKPPAQFSKAEMEKFYVDHKHLWKSFELIQDLYNYHFPAKYSTPDNLWRLFIESTTDPSLDITRPEFENWFYFDIEHVKTLDETGRKKYLFEKVSHQIIECCKRLNYSFVEFENARDTILHKNIVFDEPHKKEKASDDRKHKAFIWRKYNEWENATYIKIVGKTGNTVLFKKIADLHFRNFDRISWRDNQTLLVYKINEYAGFKQADDYYEISLSGSIDYKPQTKEETFYYGEQLMRNPETFDRGLGYVKVASQLGHGKANNILENLRLHPDERRVDILKLQPNKAAQKNNQG